MKGRTTMGRENKINDKMVDLSDRVNNFINYRGLHTNERRVIRLKKIPTICCLQQTHFKYKDIYVKKDGQCIIQMVKKNGSCYINSLY